MLCIDISLTWSALVTSCLLVTGWQLVWFRMEQSVMQAWARATLLIVLSSAPLIVRSFVLIF